MLNLDTHVLLHALVGSLTEREAVLLQREPWSIAAIVLWEIATLAQLGRIEVDLEDRELARTLARIHVWPLTLDVCRAIRQLDFRGDPADELIAATSLVHDVPLLTRDRRLVRSDRVPLAR
jgi:PIN domain nuclease of toxin-antitoxin system